MSEGTVEVVDRTDEQRFVAVVDGLESELTYRVTEGRIVLRHTGVPEALGGRGIAGELVRAAVDRAAAEGLTVAPWCPYTRRWLERHPADAARITIDWAAPPGH